MKTIMTRLDSREHCPDCGALLVMTAGGALCAHCGFEGEAPDERLPAARAVLGGHGGEGARFHLVEHSGWETVDEAA